MPGKHPYPSIDGDIFHCLGKAYRTAFYLYKFNFVHTLLTRSKTLKKYAGEGSAQRKVLVETRQQGQTVYLHHPMPGNSLRKYGSICVRYQFDPKDAAKAEFFYSFYCFWENKVDNRARNNI